MKFWMTRENFKELTKTVWLGDCRHKWATSGSVLVLVQNPLVPHFPSLDSYLPPCDLLLYLQCELLEEEALSILNA